MTASSDVPWDRALRFTLPLTLPARRCGRLQLSEELGRPLWFVALDDDLKWLDDLNEMFLHSVDLRMAGGTAQAADVRRLVVDNGADILLIDHGLAGSSGVAVAGQFARQLPGLAVYLMAESPTRELWEDARRRGVRGIVRKPFSPEGLARRIREDMEADSRQHEGPTGAGVPAAAPVAAGEAPRTVAVFSFKGGVGKSLVAVSLALAAVSPSSRRRRSAVLVDAEEGVGTTATLLGTAPEPTVLEWEEYAGERTVDPAIAGRKLAQLKCGLHCLFPPGDLERTVPAALMETVLLTLRGMYAVVVVDCGPQVTEAVLTALRQCTTLLLVVEASLDCLDKVRRGMAALSSAGVGLGKVRVLVNQARPGTGEFTSAEVREALGLQVLGRLPFDPAIKRCVNRRRPAALHAPRGPFMTALGSVASSILPGLPPAPSVSGWLSWRRA